jgi:hypothetical protein
MSDIEDDLFGPDDVEDDDAIPLPDDMTTEAAKPVSVVMGKRPFPEDLFPFRDGVRCRKFLAQYCRHLDITKAAEVAQMPVAQHFLWLEEDEEYRRAWRMIELAKEQIAHDEAYRRAVYGCLEDVLYRGDRVGTKRVFSDTLMRMFLEEKGSKEKRKDDRKKQEDQKKLPSGGKQVVIMLPDNGRINEPKVIDVENTAE